MSNYSYSLLITWADWTCPGRAAPLRSDLQTYYKLKFQCVNRQIDLYLKVDVRRFKLDFDLNLNVESLKLYVTLYSRVNRAKFSRLHVLNPFTLWTHGSDCIWKPASFHLSRALSLHSALFWKHAAWWCIYTCISFIKSRHTHALTHTPMGFHCAVQVTAGGWTTGS